MSRSTLISIAMAVGFAFLVLVVEAKTGGKLTATFKKVPVLGGFLA